MPEKDFLRKYVSLFQRTEVPEIFAIWSGISTISSMLERRVWVDMGIFSVYPNLFIVLFGESGRAKKSTAANFSESLLLQVDSGPRLIGQKSTPEALINALKRVKTDDPHHLGEMTCGGLILADELATLINRKSYEQGMGTLLIQLYDCKDKFSYKTISRGEEIIDRGYVGILAGTTPNSIREAIPRAALGDGLTSRIIFVYSNDVPKPVSRPGFSPEQKRIKQELIQYLQGLHTIEGEITLDKDALDAYDEEYNRFYYKAEELYGNPHLRGYASRRFSHLLKVAMCLMVAEEPRKTLTAKDIIGAKTLLEHAEARMPQLIELITTTESGGTTDLVLQKIRAYGGRVSRMQLQRDFAHRLDSEELSKVIKTLFDAGRIKLDTSSGILIYYIPQESNK